MPIVVLPLIVFATVAFVIVALSAPAESPLDTRLRSYGYNLGNRDLAAPFSQRVLTPVIGNLAKLIRYVSPLAMEADVRERLTRAGSPSGLDATTFLAIKGVAVAVLAAVGFVLPALGGPIGIRTIGVGAILAVLGWKLPDMWLGQQIDKRAKSILRSLPDALDLIVVCVEAGNGLESALANVAQKLHGPFGDEIERTLQEISLGKSRREALRDLSKRTNVPDLQSFIAAILQADQLGVSIAQVLRVQADAMRVRRRQRAEEQAAKAPVKMLIPLVMLIFPALMIVILGPAVVKIVAFFGAMHQAG